MFRDLSVLLFKQLYYDIPIQITGELNLHVMDPSVLFGGKRRGMPNSFYFRICRCINSYY
jgi:hypothetical protein